MSFVTGLLEDGGHYLAERDASVATLRPASDSAADLEAFQSLVRRVRDHEGDGYTIRKDHVSSDHGVGLVDLLILTLEER